MVLPLLLSFCNKAVLPLVNQLGTKPLSKHYLSCGLTLQCKLLKFFNQNPWTKSGPGDFQFGILPKIFFKLSLVISTFSCFVTLTSLCKSLTILHPYYDLPTHSICVPKTFLILQHLAHHHHIFLLPDSIIYKTAYSETFCFV